MSYIAIVHNAPVVRPLGQAHLPAESSTQAGQAGQLTQATPDESELGVLAQVAAVRERLGERGHRTTTFAVDDAERLATWLGHERPDAIFNCCESFRGRSELEPCLAGLFELLDLPYTGSRPLTLAVGLNKGLTKAILQARGVPTAAYRVVDSPAALDALSALDARVGPEGAASRLGLRWPLIVKPVAEDASIGIDEGAVVHDAEALRARVAFLTASLGAPVLVEEFVEGREFMIALLASSARDWTVLPVEEVTFPDYPPGHPRILTYAAKWLPDSAAYRGSAVSWPTLPPELVARLQRVALDAAAAVGLRDYGRVDVRVRDDGEIAVLEVNPNPDIGPESGIVATAGVAGLSYADVIATIAERALERGNRSRG